MFLLWIAVIGIYLLALAPLGLLVAFLVAEALKYDPEKMAEDPSNW